MKAFFERMNLARSIILFALVGSFALGWLGWQRSRELAELRANLEEDTQKLVANIEKLGREHTQLSKSARQEGLAGQTDLESYIRKVGIADRVEIGDLKLNPGSDPRGTKGVVDKKYTIKPTDKEHAFQRSRIANFLYKLEADSRRVKVTNLVIETAEKRIKPHEIPEDNWTFEAEVTSRQRADEGNAAAAPNAAAKPIAPAPAK